MRQITFLILMAVMLSSGQALADWELYNSKDDFTDVDNSTAFVVNETGRVLGVRCVAGKFDILIRFQEKFDDQNVFSIRYRVDKGEIIKGHGTISADGTSVFISDSQKDRLVQNFLLMQPEQFVIEVTSKRGLKHRQKFSLLGSRAPIQKVLDRCGLSYIRKD